MKWAKKSSIKKTEGRSAERKKLVWNQKSIPLDNFHVLDNYGHYLTKFEQTEIKEYKKIYYVGHKAEKSERIDEPKTRFTNEEYMCVYKGRSISSL